MAPYAARKLLFINADSVSHFPHTYAVFAKASFLRESLKKAHVSELSDTLLPLSEKEEVFEGRDE